MKEIQTKSGKILVLSEEDIFIKGRQCNNQRFTNLLLSDKNTGKLSELTDEDCKEFVEYYPQPIAVYRNYIGGLDQAWDCDNSAKESFISLLQSEGIDTSKEWLIIKTL